MNLIKIVDENNTTHYINKEKIKEVFETDKVTVIVLGEGRLVCTKESLENVYARLVLGWK